MLAVDVSGKSVHLTGWTQKKNDYYAYKRDKRFDIECSLYENWLDKLEKRREGWVDPCLPRMTQNAWIPSDVDLNLIWSVEPTGEELAEIESEQELERSIALTKIEIESSVRSELEIEYSRAVARDLEKLLEELR